MKERKMEAINVMEIYWILNELSITCWNEEFFSCKKVLLNMSRVHNGISFVLFRFNGRKIDLENIMLN